MKKEKIKERIRREYKNIIFNVIFAILILALPILFYKRNILTLVLVGIITIAGLVKWKSKLTFIIFIFGAFWGSISETIAVSLGVWSYSYPDFIKIPIWLFIVWG